MTTSAIASVTRPQALRLAVEALAERLAVRSLIEDQLPPGALWSELQDAVLDIRTALDHDYKGRVTFEALPKSLQDLYVSARARSEVGGEYMLNNHLGGLIHTVSAALARIRPL